MTEDRTNVIEKLVGQINWSEWKFQVRISLCAAECYDVASGTFVKPESSDANYTTILESYTKKEMKAQKIIGLSLTREPMMHVMNCNSSKDMWDKLCSIYEQKSKCSIHFLQQKFYNFAKDPDDSMASHFSKLDEIVQQLKDMKETISNSMLITKILMTLPPCFNHFHSAWESTPEAERTLENLRTRLMVEENRLFVQEKDIGTSEALMAKRAGKFENRPRKPDQNSRKPGKCYLCKKGFHWKRDCPEKRRKDKESKDETVSLMCMHDAAKKSDDWYLDTGATWHMTSKKEWLIDYEKFDMAENVKVGNGEFIQAQGKGNIKVSAYDGVRWSDRILIGVRYVPEIVANLYAPGRTMDNGYTIMLNSKRCEIYKNNVVVAVGARVKALYKMCFKVQSNIDATALIASNEDSLQLWHERLGHQHVAHVKKQLKRSNIKFIDMHFVCEACILGKQHRNSFKKSVNQAKRCGEIIHTDVCGPMSTVSFGGSKYFLLFKDDFSHYRFVYFLKNKDEVFNKMKDFVSMAKNQFNVNIKTIRSDNGTEFTSKNVKQFLTSNGIKHEKTVPYTPEQNGSAEREMRTIVESARSMICAKGLTKRLWAEAVNTATFVLNRSGTSTINDKTPYELWHKKSADLSDFRVFGSEVFVHVPKQLRKKWDAKSEKAFFVGYSDETKGYKVFYREQNKVKMARDVIFNQVCKTAVISLSDFNVEEDWDLNSEDEDTIIEENDQNVNHSQNNETINATNNDSVLNESSVNDSVSEYTPSSSESETDTSMESVIEVPQDSRNGALCDIDSGNIVGRRLRSANGLFCESLDKLCATALLVVNNEPENYNQAVKCDEKEKWLIAMKEEFNSLIQNKTWELIEKPKNASVIDNKWVYKIKYKSNGEIDRYKARLVVRGFTQEYGINYYETFSPVVKFSSLRAILAIAASKNLLLKQFDIKTAFLNSDLDELIFMKQPKGFEDGSDKVCKLKKSLYGLKQASRCWNKQFTAFIKQFNFKASNADPCVFIHSNTKHKTYLAIYIDDGLIVSDDRDLITSIIEYLKRHFEVKAFDVDSYLGMQIERQTDGSIWLHQSNYAKKVLDRFQMSNCNQVSIPADPNKALYDLENEKPVVFPYREAVGSIMYLAVSTRPDLSFAIGLVSRFLENPRETHVNAVKRILRYIKGTINYGIFFKSNVNLNLFAYSDSDYAGCVNTRRSTSGYVFKLGNAVISWSSERQKCVSLSTAESEYVASSEAVRELVWFRSLMDDLLNQYKQPTLMVDNESAIKLIKNPEMHRRTKHIDVKFHFIREKFEEKLFTIQSVPSEQQIADIFTKPLAKVRFAKLRKEMSLFELN